MESRHLLAGPRYPRLESAAFERLAERLGDQPDCVLYVARSDHPADRTRDRWREHGAPLSVTVETFDRIVADCFERDQFSGHDYHVDEPLRDRLVELAVERLDDPVNPLAVDDELPAGGLCTHVEELLSLLEFADLHSPEATQTRLREEGLPFHAETVPEVAAAFEDARSDLLGDDTWTLRAERYRHVLDESQSLSEWLPSVEHVVLGGFTLFSPLERQLVAALADTWPTVALLPQVVDTDDGVGVDEGAERALGAYQDLGFQREYLASGSSHADRISIPQQLYRHAGITADEAPGADAPTGFDLVQPETVPQELRYVAREIRSRLANGTSPEDLGIVLTDAGTYGEPLLETLERYEIPATLPVERDLSETALGEVLDELTTLAREDPPADSMTALLSNPLVTVGQTNPDLDQDELLTVARRLTSRRLETACDHLDSGTVAEVQSIVADARALRNCSLDALPERVEALLKDLGITDAIDALPTSLRGRTESQALDRLGRTLETLAQTDGVADLERGDALDRLDRALGGLSLDSGGTRTDDHVVVCELDDAFTREFEHAYVLGLTAGHVPSSPERPHFFRPINEAHEDFEQADVQARTRYHVGLLLASDAALTLSVPERSVDGDPYVEADVVTELRRVTDVDPTPVSPTDARPGCYEDVLRSLGTTFAHDAVDEYEPIVDRVADSGSIDDVRCRRLQAGVACGAARASDDITPHDGRLSPETIATLHGTDRREPFSPSRLETYAKCGFKYYAGEVLDIDEPDDIELEPDAADRGGYVHDVLEHYYADLQDGPGEPVEIVADHAEREAHMLKIALERLDEAFDADAGETAFHHEWLVGVLAGLGDPAENPYYGTGVHDAPEEGLLVRFLDHEFAEVGKTTARPAWFEARVGRSTYGPALRDDPVVVGTPVGEVTLHGMIDRVDVVPGTEPMQLVVRDYKTGSTPSEDETLGGTSFQLPVYAHLIEDLLNDVETVGGTYYQVKPPTDVSHGNGLVTSQEHARWAGYEEIDTPLTRHRKPTFETHEAYRRFVEETLPERLGQLSDGLSEGLFHPTVLDPDDAGCWYCGYSDVCDVRPHRRREVIDAIDDGDLAAYVPLTARGDDPADVLEVE